ncbi:class I SAM-dependent methyltransferase [Actinomadura sp. WMMB 499]|uniref:class I SAM-dependent methyltransferase n=1 Tax=Actinomadura sp. WMMB 499 TaxID=1219491 RepID=UPI00124589AB|nr:methyltransferase [Actinomadura sp. WMMB 499]QFG19846.1 methyltransferase [Actinomadura sp. WMMB 499]
MGEHYFAERPGAASRRRTVDLVLPDLHLRLDTDGGVFSPDRVDPGTRILLETVPPPPPGGDLLDLGCGYGPIALTMAARAPAARVWGVDVNRRALELAEANAASAALPNARFTTADTLDPALRFAAIWSNPPIRIGKTALHDLLLAWLPRLRPAAHAHLVVQKHLGSDSLQRWLNEQGMPTERIASRSSYRVLRVTAPDTSPTASPTPPPLEGPTR